VEPFRAAADVLGGDEEPAHDGGGLVDDLIGGALDGLVEAVLAQLADLAL
jgi:hypothetical protein